MADVQAPAPPVVTIRGGPELCATRRSRSYGRLLVWPLAALAVVLASAQGAHPVDPRTLSVDARLAVAGDVPMSRSGVLVVPVVLQDHGQGHRVVHARAYAGPVRADPAVSPPRAVAPGAAQRFVVLLSPDCVLLGPHWNMTFGASLLVRVAHGPVARDLVLDLGADPAVASKVRRLCQRR